MRLWRRGAEDDEGARWRWSRVTAVVMAVATITAFQPFSARADTSVVGSQGTDTSLPATDSAVPLSGRGRFAGLRITVNQTKNLTDQAISVTWSGAAPTTTHDFQENFLQIFECWGNDDGTNAANPGPPATQCEFGNGPVFNATFATSRVLSVAGWDDFEALKAQGVGYNENNAAIWMPFRSADGRIVNIDHATNIGQTTAPNPFFDLNTTNEIGYAHTNSDGTGQVLFPVYTGRYAPGLGCGEAVDQPGGGQVRPRCWLVIVPRGLSQDENVGWTPNSNEPVFTSPLAPDVWTNRIAVPLDFNPVEASCPSGAAQRIVSGSEVVSAAANNWNPVLCSQPGSPPYVYQAVGDPVARSQLLAGTAALTVTSQPLDPTLVDPATPVVYGPISLSGLVVGFNLERSARVSGLSKAEAAAETLLNGTRVAHFNLTPRLVAKLLTQSYRGQYPNVAVGKNDPVSGLTWLQNNPPDLISDQDFIRYNPEFQDLSPTNSQTLAAPLVESRISDATGQLWQWVLADPEARAWLAGGSDGDSPPMNVNPYYSTDPKVNPTGAFGNRIPNTFPKSDPYCYQDPTTVGTPPMPVPPLCLPDVNPYALDMATAAREARVANNGAKYASTFAQIPSQYYVSQGPQLLGHRGMISVTDTASAARFGLQVASLSRAGDDGADRKFVAPDQAGLLAGAQAMVPDAATPAVLQPAPSASAPGAYPLTVLTYAATMPARLDATARKDYARFVSYAAGAGQTVGFSFGNLPPGYAPLPPNLRDRANAAAAAILNGAAPLATVPSTTVAPVHRSSARGGQSGRTGVTSRTVATGGSSTATTAAPPSVALPVVNPASPSGAVARTLAQAVGAIRYTLPVTFALGIAAAAGWLIDKWRRKRPGRDLPPTPPAIE